MGPLRLLVCAALTVLAAPVAADPLDRWKVPIRAAAQKFGLPADWIRRVMRVESGGATLRRAQPLVSPAGAIGLMQLMPGTWHDMQVALRLGSDPHEPAANIMAGAFYLRLLYDRFGYPGLFAAYNAGPDRYARYLSRGVPLPAETNLYLRRLRLRQDRAPIDPPHRPTILISLAARAESRVAPDQEGLERASSRLLFEVLGSSGGP